MHFKTSIKNLKKIKYRRMYGEGRHLIQKRNRNKEKYDLNLGLKRRPTKENTDSAYCCNGCKKVSDKQYLHTQVR